PLPFTPGLVTAGEVLGAGDGVCGLPAGTRVVGCSFDFGGYASHRVLPAQGVVPLPDAVTHEVAATAVESYATMLFALTRRTAVRPGEWVPVLGAGGGIGLAAVGVARSLRAGGGGGGARRGGRRGGLPGRGPEGPGAGTCRRGR